jgi:hypothetical protein
MCLFNIPFSWIHICSKRFCKKNAARLFDSLGNPFVRVPAGTQRILLKRSSAFHRAGLLVYVSILSLVPSIFSESLGLPRRGPSPVPANMISSHQLFFGSVDANKRRTKNDSQLFFLSRSKTWRVYF